MPSISFPSILGHFVAVTSTLSHPYLCYHSHLSGKSKPKGALALVARRMVLCCLFPMVPQENGKRSLPGTLMELKGEGVLNLDLVKCLKGNPFHCSVKSPPLPLPCGILSGIKWHLSLQTSGAPQSPATTQTKKTALFL